MESCRRKAVSILRRHLPFPLLHPLPFSLQVRKSSQEVLLALLEQGLISHCDIEGKVCPILLERSAPDHDDDCRAEALSVSLPWESLVHHRLMQDLNFGQHHSLSKVARASSGKFCGWP